MRSEQFMKAGNATLSSPQAAEVSRETASDWSAADGQEHHRIFLAVWYSANLLLIISVAAAIYATMWEYSTRKYLKGFSDAIIPAAAAPEQKIQAILDWMTNGPARLQGGRSGSSPDRDPTDTLNYNSLLRVCGTATNAFINLADSGNLAARRILLLDARNSAKHVDAEVLVNGRWIVVDPVFRAILRGPDGAPLTREELTNPAIFSAAIVNIPKYDPSYSFERTAHVRLARLYLTGTPLRKTLDFLLPGWEDSTTVSLLVERESLAAMVAVIVIVLFLGLLRVSLRWYGERRLGIRSVRVRAQLRRACQAFLDTTR
jgi:hypothetical protein